MIYPKKRKAMFGLDLGQLNMKEELEKGNEGAFGGGIVSGVGSFAEKGIRSLGTSNMGYGVEHTSAAANIGGGMIGGAFKGADMLKGAGVPGVIVGGIAGAAAGIGKGIVSSFKNNKSLAENTMLSRQATHNSAENQKGITAYNTLEQKQVMENGGEIPDGEDQPTREEAVILGGKRHKQGGNDILDENGQKVAETEREEIVFTAGQTEMIDRSIKIIELGNENEFLNLGSYIKEILLNRTEDHSGKFKELNYADI